MRIWSLFLLFLPPALAAQVPWRSSPPIESSTTLVDVLSADPDYTTLIRLLQRARLIPTLNKLNGSTLFAPTNDAIKKHPNEVWHAVLADQQDTAVNDNVRERLRQELFYHLLNYSLSEPPPEARLQVLETLHFPQVSRDSPSQDPPPWIPEPNGTLGGESQRLRMFSKNGSIFVGVDAFGKGGAEVVKGSVQAGNGVVFGLSEVLKVPPDLATVVSQQPSLSYFNKVLTPEITKLLNSTSELTLFLPTDPAWNALEPLEKLYLESPFATDDLTRILNMHAVQKGVRWSDSFGKGTNLTTVDGRQLEIVVSRGKTTVSTANLTQPDIYASNGVLHLVSSLLIPPGTLRLTPEKYLLALNCTSFVSLLHSVDLTKLINVTDAAYTILAPRDDVLRIYGDGELPKRGTEELKRHLQYHFIPGIWTPAKLHHRMLLETALEEEGLAGGRQVLEVEVNEDQKKSKTVRFGGAGVLGDMVKINNTLIYFLSRPLIPPTDPLQTALPSLELSSFLAAIASTSLADTLRTTPRTTFLIPRNSAFKQLGMLVSAHLLSPSSKTDLEQVILHHTIQDVQYTESFRNGSQRTFPTLEGSDIQIEQSSNGTYLLSPSGGWAGMKSQLHFRNMLSQTGVVHELSNIIIPRSVSLTITNLVKAAKGMTMISLVKKAGLDWVLNGTAPPEGSPWADQGLSGVGWTLLCPIDDAFKGYNLTQLFADEDGILLLVRQHLIPTPVSRNEDIEISDFLNNNQPLPMGDLLTYSTLLSPSSAYGDIFFRSSDKAPGGYVVGIKGVRGTEGLSDWAHVTAWGRSTTGGGTGGVIAIDHLLVPYHPSWWVEYRGPAVVLVGGIILICLFFYGVRAIWRRDTTEATYEPVGGFGADDD